MSEPTPRIAISTKVPVRVARAIEQRTVAEGRTKQAVISDILSRQLDGGDREILDLAGTADLLGVSEHALLERIERGDFPARRFGDEWRCSRGAVLDWLRGTDEVGRRQGWLRGERPA